MQLIRHPLVERDIIGIADHIVQSTMGDIGAARRRLDEIDLLLEDISKNPFSGTRLAGKLEGWLVRHGGKDHRLTVVFKSDAERRLLYVAMIAFGGRNWMVGSEARSEPEVW